MGSLLSSRIALEMPDYFDGIILTVPWLDNHERIKICKKRRCLISIAQYFCRNKETPGSTDFDEK